MKIKPLIVIAIICALFVGYYLLLKHALTSPAERGQFGDMFGGMTALFSAFAFCGLLYTISLQSNQIQQATDQLIQNKKEFEIQQKVQALTILISLYQTKLSKLDVSHLDANLIQNKINALAAELETLLLKK